MFTTAYHTHFFPPSNIRFTSYCWNLNVLHLLCKQSIDGGAVAQIKGPSSIQIFYDCLSSRYFARLRSRNNFYITAAAKPGQLSAAGQNSLLPSLVSSSRKGEAVCSKSLETIVSFLPIVLAHSALLFLSAGEMGIAAILFGDWNLAP